MYSNLFPTIKIGFPYTWGETFESICAFLFTLLIALPAIFLIAVLGCIIYTIFVFVVYTCFYISNAYYNICDFFRKSNTET